MALMKLLAILILCGVYRFWSEATSIPEDDSEIEAQLKILNKPAVKTFVTKEGETIGCIPIHKQPAFDHPLLKDHKIQLEPNLPLFKKDKTPTDAKSVSFGLREPCPIGTVPIPRVTKEDLIRARSIPKEPYVSTNRLNNDFTKQHAVYLYDDNTKMIKYGAGAKMTIYNLTLTPDQFSSHNIWIQTGPPDHISMIIAGWRVSQNLNGDTVSRLFTYWTGNRQNGCYNVRCPGFVQVHKEVTTNYPFYDTSVPGGKRYELQLGIEQDPTHGNWWLILDADPPIKVGYWPKELFPYLQNGSWHAAWGGVGQEAGDGICPPLGSGRDANSGYSTAAYFRDIYWANIDRGHYPPSWNMYESVDKSGVYGLMNDKDVKDMGYTLRYGGPGGKCV